MTFKGQNNSEMMCWRQHIKHENNARLNYERTTGRFTEQKFYQGRFNDKFTNSLRDTNSGPWKAKKPVDGKVLSVTSSEAVTTTSHSQSTRDDKRAKSMLAVSSAVARELERQGYKRPSSASHSHTSKTSDTTSVSTQ